MLRTPQCDLVRPGDVMVRLLARVMGVGKETVDMQVHEVLSRNLRDRLAVAGQVEEDLCRQVVEEDRP